MTNRLLSAAAELDRIAASVRPGAIRQPCSLLSASATSTSSIFYIALPPVLADRFPDYEVHNYGHKPHVTLFMVSTDPLPKGQEATLLNMARRLSKGIRPFRLLLDGNSGLQNFPIQEGAEEVALWLGVRSDPKDTLAKIHDGIKKALRIEGLPHETFPSYVPHATWSYVAPGIEEYNRARMSALAAQRIGSQTWVEIRYINLDIGAKSYRIPLRGMG